MNPYIHSIVLSAIISMSHSSTTTSTTINIRPYRDADKSECLKIFEQNIREEWGKYHDGRYLNPNAENYIQSVLLDPDSDLNNIPNIYASDEKGVAECLFWVMEDGTGIIQGMCGLQILDCGNHREGEIRRNCILPDFRGQGWGSRLCRLAQQRARELQLSRIICSTPEHGDDVLNFYKKLGFTEFGDRQELHKTPIKEVFLEWKAQH